MLFTKLSLGKKICVFIIETLKFIVTVSATSWFASRRVVMSQLCFIHPSLASVCDFGQCLAAAAKRGAVLFTAIDSHVKRDILHYHDRSSGKVSVESSNSLQER